MMKYIIIQATSSVSLEDKVMDAIGRGYRPSGGVAVYLSWDNDAEAVYLIQAMIK